jgi:aerobic-type carbon monoxide dehydrogenase small subunit (CoxS/CutS family)
MPHPTSNIPHPTSLSISLTVNGHPTTIDIDPAERLLDTLRYRLALPGAKEGCGEGECGACTVILDGVPVNSCLVPTFQVRGRDVRTIESVPPSDLGPMLECGATQCGACTPGVVMMADWVRRNPSCCASRPLRELMAGNLCRCTGYDGIIDGVQAWITAGTSSTSAKPGEAPRGTP